MHSSQHLLRIKLHAGSMMVLRTTTAEKNRVGLRTIAGRSAVAITTMSTPALLAGLGFVGARAHEEAWVASQRAMRGIELHGSITHLNEELATTARMGAMSGEKRWTERFEDLAPKLDAAIAEASTIATPEIRAALATTTGEAHNDLITVERRVLSLAARGDSAAARALLDGPEFGYLQEVYASGLGYDIGQGWLFGRPMPAREVDLLVAERGKVVE